MQSYIFIFYFAKKEEIKGYRNANILKGKDFMEFHTAFYVSVASKFKRFLYLQKYKIGTACF